MRESMRVIAASKKGDMNMTLGGGGTQTRSLSVQKNEKITRTVSTYTKIKFYIIFIYYIFSTMDIKSFTNWEGGGKGGVVIH